MLLFPESEPKKNFRVNGLTKTVTPHLRSIVPNIQRYMAYFAPPSLLSLVHPSRPRARVQRPIPLGPKHPRPPVPSSESRHDADHCRGNRHRHCRDHRDADHCRGNRHRHRHRHEYRHCRGCRGCCPGLGHRVATSPCRRWLWLAAARRGAARPLVLPPPLPHVPPPLP
jgi:hypothetical protein